MKRLAFARLLLVAVLPVLFLAACDSSGSNEKPDDHEFQFNITPPASPSMQKVTTRAAEDTTLNGYSFYHNPPASQSYGDRNVFLLHMNENSTLEERRNQEGLFGFAKSIGGRPGTGDYPITEASSEAYQDGEAFIFKLYYDYGSILDGDLGGVAYYSVIDGTITFEPRSAPYVAGSVDAVAEVIRYVDPDSTIGYEIVRDTTTISGKFQAKDSETIVTVPTGSPTAH